MNTASKLLVGILLFAASAAGFRHHNRTRWLFEFRSGDRSIVATLRGSLALDSTAIGSDRLSVDSGDFVIGDGSLKTLPPPLVPDPCVNPTGKADVIQTHLSVLINFTLPQSSDCGLIVRGTIHSDTVMGTWYQPGMAGYRAKGPFVMWRAQ
jgi:hypothetical protein